MTDFFDALEQQLVDAARDRRRRLRAARARRAGAVLAAIVVLGAGITAGAAALGGTGEGDGAPAGRPATTTATATTPKLSYLHPLRGLRVAVLNATTQSGLGADAAKELAAFGATVAYVGDYDRHDVKYSHLLFTPGLEQTIDIVAQQSTCRIVAPIGDHVRRLAGDDVDVVLVVGQDRVSPH